MPAGCRKACCSDLDLDARVTWYPSVSAPTPRRWCGVKFGHVELSGPLRGTGVAAVAGWPTPLLVVVYRRDLSRIWREPVFRHPVLIIESDDWGAGPLSQAAALRDIANVLARHRDATGRAPVFNLALVLAVPDGPAIAGRTRATAASASTTRCSAPSCQRCRKGRSRGVFALAVAWHGALLARCPDGQRRCAGAGAGCARQLPATYGAVCLRPCKAAGSTRPGCPRDRTPHAGDPRGRGGRGRKPTRASSARRPRWWCRPPSSGPAKRSRLGQSRGSSAS